MLPSFFLLFSCSEKPTTQGIDPSPGDSGITVVPVEPSNDDTADPIDTLLLLGFPIRRSGKGSGNTLTSSVFALELQLSRTQSKEHTEQSYDMN